MKKILWLFGQPGSGRKTLINNLKNNREDVGKLLGIEDANISILEIPYNRDSFSNDYKKADERKNNIYNRVREFISDDSDVLLILGEYPDYDRSNNNIVNIGTSFSELNQEIVFLNPSDLDILYERLKDTDWFKFNYKVNLGRYSKDWLKFSTIHMKETFNKMEEMGYKVVEIDTTTGYDLSDKKVVKII